MAGEWDVVDVRPSGMFDGLLQAGAAPARQRGLTDEEVGLSAPAVGFNGTSIGEIVNYNASAQTAAFVLAQLLAYGQDVLVNILPDTETDWNDVLRQHVIT